MLSIASEDQCKYIIDFNPTAFEERKGSSFKKSFTGPQLVSHPNFLTQTDSVQAKDETIFNSPE